MTKDIIEIVIGENVTDILKFRKGEERRLIFNITFPDDDISLETDTNISLEVVEKANTSEILFERMDSDFDKNDAENEAIVDIYSEDIDSIGNYLLQLKISVELESIPLIEKKVISMYIKDSYD